MATSAGWLTVEVQIDRGVRREFNAGVSSTWIEAWLLGFTDYFIDRIAGTTPRVVTWRVRRE